MIVSSDGFRNKKKFPKQSHMKTEHIPDVTATKTRFVLKSPNGARGFLGRKLGILVGDICEKGQRRHLFHSGNDAPRGPLLRGHIHPFQRSIYGSDGITDRGQ